MTARPGVEQAQRPMHHHLTRSHRPARLLAAGAVLAAVTTIAACGSRSPNTASSAATSARSVESSGSDWTSSALAFSKCMRANACRTSPTRRSSQPTRRQSSRLPTRDQPTVARVPSRSEGLRRRTQGTLTDHDGTRPTCHPADARVVVATARSMTANPPRRRSARPVLASSPYVASTGTAATPPAIALPVSDTSDPDTARLPRHSLRHSRPGSRAVRGPLRAVLKPGSRHFAGKTGRSHSSEAGFESR